eukprot:jgi/Mesvir1/15425/Mv06609-RA.1
MTTSLKDMGVGRLKKLYTEEIESDPTSTTSGVTIVSQGKIDIVPNVSGGNDATRTNPVPATDAAAEKVTTNFTLAQAGVPTETRQAHTYSADAVTVMSKKGLGNTGNGGNLWITGDTAVAGSSVAVEQVKFVDSSVSTTNPTLSLSAASNVTIAADLVLKSPDVDVGGKIATSSGDLFLNPASGVVKVNGNVQVDGTLTSVNTTVLNSVIMEKTLSLANTQNTTVATWAFDGNSATSAPTTANPTGVPITFTTGKASISNGALILPGGATPTTNAAATAANVSAFPTGTQSYEISFNISYNGVPVSGAATVRRLFSYGTLICNWYGDGKIEATAGGVTLATPVNTLAMAALTQKKYKVTMRRTYVDAPLNSLSTFEIFVDGVQKSVSTGTGLATHSLSSPALVLGNDGTGYLVPLTFDDVRIELVSPPTNVNADGAGLVVAGDAAINSKAAERSITWKRNVAQELGDNTGSYWHIKGGQLMFSRLIDTTKRKAPGTNVLLSSLPTKGASTESNMWTLATNGTAATGTAVLTYASTPTGAASHTGGYFQTNYGYGAVTTSYYSATNIGRATGGYEILVTGIVKPFTSLSTATGGDVGTGAGAAMTAPFLCGVANSTNTNANMAELLTIGKDGTAGSYVSVWAWRGGRLLMFTGNHYTETAGIVVGASEFVLGVLLSSSGPVLELPVSNGATTEPHLWKLAAYTGAGPYLTADSAGSASLTYVSSNSSIGGGDSWLGEWFNDSANNVQNTGSSTSNYGTQVGKEAFTVTAPATVSNGVITLPAGSSGTKNLAYAQAVGLNTKGTLDDDGYGEWTMEASVASTGSNSFSIMWMGFDGNTRRIQVYSSGGGILICTESHGGLYEYGDQQLSIPSSTLNTFKSNNLPGNGSYHKYRLARKSVVPASAALGAKYTDPSALFRFWYDDMEIPLVMPSTIGLLWTTGSTWFCNPPITSVYNYIRLGHTQRYSTFQTCTVEYVRFSNGLTTTYPSPGGFMWAYEFNGTYANTGSESYSTTFAQGTSSLVTDGSVRGLSVPSATGANTILATIVGLNTRGASDNDGFGNWTVEVRMKFNASGASTQANVFMMGQDNTGTGAGARIGGTNVLVCGIVYPVSSFAAATGGVVTTP